MKGSRSGLSEKIIPLASHAILTVINLYCLLTYFTQVADMDMADLSYVAYLTMLANGVFGLTKLVSDESFIDLRILLDYAQIVLPHPFLTAVLWQKNGVGTNETALMHCFFGMAAFLFFAFMEYKRQDLTDLALIYSILSSVTVGALKKNYFACGAGVLMGAAYFGVKRGDECTNQPSPAMSSYFNFAMAAYAVVTLGQAEPKSWIPSLMEAAASEPAE